MGGYIKIPRDLFDGWDYMWERYSHREAFIDLIRMAAYSTTTITVSGKDYTLRRGQVAASKRFLATRWGWSVGTVYRFLDFLFRTGKCLNQGATPITVLTIVDYDSYQGIGPDPVPPPIPEPQPEPEAKPATDKDAVDRLYKLYPAKCPISGRSTGKSAKDKEKLTRLLRKKTEDELAGTIKHYIDDCTKSRTYFKNFSTFLNNLPDYGDEAPRPDQEPSSASARQLTVKEMMELEEQMFREDQEKWEREKKQHEKK